MLLIAVKLTVLPLAEGVVVSVPRCSMSLENSVSHLVDRPLWVLQSGCKKSQSVSEPGKNERFVEFYPSFHLEQLKQAMWTHFICLINWSL